MVDVKKVPNVRRSIRFLDEFACLEVHEMPDRSTVQLIVSSTGPRGDDEDDRHVITLTADQWKVLQSLDHIDEDRERGQSGGDTTHLNDEGAVH